MSTLEKGILFLLGGFEELGFGAALVQRQDELTPALPPGRGAFFVLVVLWALRIETLRFSPVTTQLEI